MTPLGARAQARAGQGPSLTFGLLETLGGAILAGDYAGRPFPTEADIARSHGVSRTVTREAVKMLTAKGLLGSRPRWGTFVRPLEQWALVDSDVLRWLVARNVSISLLRQCTELRLAVEPEAAALAAIRATPGCKAAINSAFVRLEAAARGDDLNAAIAFHTQILQAAGNPFYHRFCDFIAAALTMTRRFGTAMPRHAKPLASHAMVREAIADGDADAARATMQRLISDILFRIERSDMPSAPRILRGPIGCPAAKSA